MSDIGPVDPSGPDFGRESSDPLGDEAIKFAVKQDVGEANIALYVRLYKMATNNPSNAAKAAIDLNNPVRTLIKKLPEELQTAIANNLQNALIEQKRVRSELEEALADPHVISLMAMANLASAKIKKLIFGEPRKAQSKDDDEDDDLPSGYDQHGRPT